MEKKNEVTVTVPGVAPASIANRIDSVVIALLSSTRMVSVGNGGNVVDNAVRIVKQVDEAASRMRGDAMLFEQFLKIADRLPRTRAGRLVIPLVTPLYALAKSAQDTNAYDVFVAVVERFDDEWTLRYERQHDEEVLVRLKSTHAFLSMAECEEYVEDQKLNVSEYFNCQPS